MELGAGGAGSQLSVLWRLRRRTALAPGRDLQQPHVLWSTPERAERLKRMLNDLHLSKIDMADSVLVVNSHGYIGESTAARSSTPSASASRSATPTAPPAPPALRPAPHPCTPVRGCGAGRRTGQPGPTTHRPEACMTEILDRRQRLYAVDSPLA